MPAAEPTGNVCTLCDFDIDHRHPNGLPPVVPCRACFANLHDYCDPLSYWCACDCNLGKDAS